MKVAINAEAAAALIPDGAVCLIGGFMGVGSPHRLIDALVRRGAKGLTVIANDTAMPGRGIGKLITAGAVAKVIASHIGLNPETQAKMLAGEIEVELVPQGTLIERIRAGGVGLGGVLTADRPRHARREGQASHRSRWQALPTGEADPRRFRPDRRQAGRLLRQPRIFADRPQLQSNHRARGRTWSSPNRKRSCRSASSRPTASRRRACSSPTCSKGPFDGRQGGHRPPRRPGGEAGDAGQSRHRTAEPARAIICRRTSTSFSRRRMASSA